MAGALIDGQFQIPKQKKVVAPKPPPKPAPVVADPKIRTPAARPAAVPPRYVFQGVVYTSLVAYENAQRQYAADRQAYRDRVARRAAQAKAQAEAERRRRALQQSQEAYKTRQFLRQQELARASALDMAARAENVAQRNQALREAREAALTAKRRVSYDALKRRADTTREQQQFRTLTGARADPKIRTASQRAIMPERMSKDSQFYGRRTYAARTALRVRATARETGNYIDALRYLDEQSRRSNGRFYDSSLFDAIWSDYTKQVQQISDPLEKLQEQAEALRESGDLTGALGIVESEEYARLVAEYERLVNPSGRGETGQIHQMMRLAENIANRRDRYLERVMLGEYADRAKITQNSEIIERLSARWNDSDQLKRRGGMSLRTWVDLQREQASREAERIANMTFNGRMREMGWRFQPKVGFTKQVENDDGTTTTYVYDRESGQALPKGVKSKRAHLDKVLQANGMSFAQLQATIDARDSAGSMSERSRLNDEIHIMIDEAVKAYYNEIGFEKVISPNGLNDRGSHVRAAMVNELRLRTRETLLGYLGMESGGALGDLSRAPITGQLLGGLEVAVGAIKGQMMRGRVAIQGDDSFGILDWDKVLGDIAGVARTAINPTSIGDHEFYGGNAWDTSPAEVARNKEAYENYIRVYDDPNSSLEEKLHALKNLSANTTKGWSSLIFEAGLDPLSFVPAARFIRGGGLAIGEAGGVRRALTGAGSDVLSGKMPTLLKDFSKYTTPRLLGGASSADVAFTRLTQQAARAAGLDPADIRKMVGNDPAQLREFLERAAKGQDPQEIAKAVSGFEEVLTGKPKASSQQLLTWAQQEFIKQQGKFIDPVGLRRTIDEQIQMATLAERELQRAIEVSTAQAARQSITAPLQQVRQLRQLVEGAPAPNRPRLALAVTQQAKLNRLETGVIKALEAQATLARQTADLAAKLKQGTTDPLMRQGLYKNMMEGRKRLDEWATWPTPSGERLGIVGSRRQALREYREQIGLDQPSFYSVDATRLTADERFIDQQLRHAHAAMGATTNAAQRGLWQRQIARLQTAKAGVKVERNMLDGGRGTARRIVASRKDEVLSRIQPNKVTRPTFTIDAANIEFARELYSRAYDRNVVKVPTFTRAEAAGFARAMDDAWATPLLRTNQQLDMFAREFRIKSLGEAYETLRYVVRSEAGHAAYGDAYRAVQRQMERVLGKRGVAKERLDDWMDNGHNTRKGGTMDQYRDVDKLVRSAVVTARKGYHRRGSQRAANKGKGSKEPLVLSDADPVTIVAKVRTLRAAGFTTRQYDEMRAVLGDISRRDLVGRRMAKAAERLSRNNGKSVRENFLDLREARRRKEAEFDIEEFANRPEHWGLTDEEVFALWEAEHAVDNMVVPQRDLTPYQAATLDESYLAHAGHRTSETDLVARLLGGQKILPEGTLELKKGSFGGVLDKWLGKIPAFVAPKGHPVFRRRAVSSPGWRPRLGPESDDELVDLLLSGKSGSMADEADDLRHLDPDDPSNYVSRTDDVGPEDMPDDYVAPKPRDRGIKDAEPVDAAEFGTPDGLPVMRLDDDHWFWSTKMGTTGRVKGEYVPGEGVYVARSAGKETVAHEAAHAIVESPGNRALREQVGALLTEDIVSELHTRARLATRGNPHEVIAELFARWWKRDLYPRRPEGNPLLAGASRRRNPRNFDDLRAGMLLEDDAPLSAGAIAALNELDTLFAKFSMKMPHLRKPAGPSAADINKGKPGKGAPTKGPTRNIMAGSNKMIGEALEPFRERARKAKVVRRSQTQVALTGTEVPEWFARTYGDDIPAGRGSQFAPELPKPPKDMTFEERAVFMEAYAGQLWSRVLDDVEFREQVRNLRGRMLRVDDIDEGYVLADLAEYLYSDAGRTFFNRRPARPQRAVGEAAVADVPLSLEAGKAFTTKPPFFRMVDELGPPDKSGTRRVITEREVKDGEFTGRTVAKRSLQPQRNLRIVVTGSRPSKVNPASDIARSDLVHEALDLIHKEHGIRELVEGGANGADSWAREWARKNRVPVRTVKANWDRRPDGSYNKAAGFERNSEMLDIMDEIRHADGTTEFVRGVDGVVGFPEDLNKISSGTADALKKAKQRGLPTWIPERVADRAARPAKAVVARADDSPLTPAARAKLRARVDEINRALKTVNQMGGGTEMRKARIRSLQNEIKKAIAEAEADSIRRRPARGVTVSTEGIYISEGSDAMTVAHELFHAFADDALNVRSMGAIERVISSMDTRTYDAIMDAIRIKGKSTVNYLTDPHEFMAELYAYWRMGDDAGSLANTTWRELRAALPDYGKLRLDVLGREFEVLGAISDPARWGFGTVHPPFGNRAKMRAWLVENGYWSPKTAEDIASGAYVWSVADERRFWEANYGYTPDWTKDEILEPLLDNPTEYFEAMKGWGFFDDDFENAVGNMLDGTVEFAKTPLDKILFGGPGVRQARSFEEMRAWFYERYGELVSKDGGKTFYTVPWLQTFDEYSTWVGQFGKNAQRLFGSGVKLDPTLVGAKQLDRLGEVLERTTRRHLDQIKTKMGKEGLDPEVWLPQERMRFAYEVVDYLRDSREWQGFFNAAGMRLLNMVGKLQRLFIIWFPAFPIMNAIDAWGPKAMILSVIRNNGRYIHATKRHWDEIVPDLYIVGDEVATTWGLGNRTAYVRVGDKRYGASEQIRALFEGTADIPLSLSAKAEGRLRLNFARSVAGRAYDDLVAGGMDHDLAVAFARFEAHKQLKTFFSSLADAPDWLKALNQFVPFFSYNFKNSMLGVRTIYEAPWIALSMHRLRNLITENNREIWSRLYGDAPFPEEDKDWQRLTIDTGVEGWGPYHIDLSVFSDWTRAMAGLGSVEVDDFIRVPHPWQTAWIGLITGQDTYWGAKAGIENLTPWFEIFKWFGEGGMAQFDENNPKSKDLVQVLSQMLFFKAFGRTPPVQAEVQTFFGLMQIDEDKGWDYYREHPNVAAYFALNGTQAVDLFKSRKFSWHAFASEEDIAKFDEAMKGYEDLKTAFDMESAKYHLEPWSAEAKRLKQERYAALRQYIRANPILEEVWMWTSAKDWLTETENFRVDLAMEDFFSIKAPRRANFDDDLSYQQAMLGYIQKREKYLELNPAVAERLYNANTAVEQAWFDHELQWAETLEDIAEIKIQIAKEEAKLEPDRDKISALYTLADANYAALDRESFGAFYDLLDRDVAQGRQGYYGRKAVNTINGIMQRAKQIVVLPGRSDYFYEIANKAEKAQIEVDEKYYGAMGDLMDELKAKDDFSEFWTEMKARGLLKRYLGENPNKKIDYDYYVNISRIFNAGDPIKFWDRLMAEPKWLEMYLSRPSADKSIAEKRETYNRILVGKRYFNEMQGLWNEIGDDYTKFYDALARRPWLQGEYFRRNPDKAGNGTSGTYSAYAVGISALYDKAKSGSEFYRLLEAQPALMAEYFRRNPDAKARYEEGRTYYRSISGWIEALKRNDFAEAQRLWDAMPAWVQARYFTNNPNNAGGGGDRRGPVQATAYSAAMGKWVEMLKAKKYDEANAYFKGLPDWIKERYYTRHPEQRAKNDFDNEQLSNSAAYFLAADGDKAKYLTAELGRWLQQHGNSESAMRGMIQAIYRAIPSSNPWLRRTFRERHPEIFGKEAQGERSVSKVLNTLARYPEMQPFYEKAFALQTATYESQLRRNKVQPQPWTMERKQRAIRRRRRRAARLSSEWSTHRRIFKGDTPRSGDRRRAGVAY